MSENRKITNQSLPSKTKSVNWKTLVTKNKRFTSRRMGVGPYLLIDGGSDYIILGQKWHVFHRFEHARIGMQGPEEFGQFTASMDKAAGITKGSALKGQSCFEFGKGSFVQVIVFLLGNR